MCIWGKGQESDCCFTSGSFNKRYCGREGSACQQLNDLTFTWSCTRIPGEGCQDLTSETYELLQPIKTGWRILGLFLSSVHLIS